LDWNRKVVVDIVRRDRKEKMNQKKRNPGAMIESFILR
jgi:hypothetical protein